MRERRLTRDDEQRQRQPERDGERGIRAPAPGSQHGSDPSLQKGGRFGKGGERHGRDQPACADLDQKPGVAADVVPSAQDAGIAVELDGRSCSQTGARGRREGPGSRRRRSQRRSFPRMPRRRARWSPRSRLVADARGVPRSRRRASPRRGAWRCARRRSAPDTLDHSIATADRASVRRRQRSARGVARQSGGE